MSGETESLYMLTKFKLIEMVKDLYADDRERRKYLNLRTKTDLVEMIQERLSTIHHNRTMYHNRPTNPSYYHQTQAYTPPPTPRTDERYIQTKYASFLERKNGMEETKPKEVCQKKKGVFRRGVSHADEEQTVVSHTPSHLSYDDIENTNAVVMFPV